MTKALIVDDSKVDQHRAGSLLKHRADLEVLYADNGREALDIMARDTPDLVITDMQMPEIDGLQLVEQIRARFDAVPVILMTAHGSEAVAAEALRKGAASYVPKVYLSRDLAPTVERVLALAEKEADRQKALECLTRSEYEFILDNDDSRAQPLIAFLRSRIRQVGVCGDNGLTRVGVAIDEALANAIIHGNLEVSSELRETGLDDYYAVVDDRRRQSPWRDRRVRLNAVIRPEEVRITVRDEGKGFDPANLPDPTDPANLARTSGRGLLLIRTFMDEVHHNATGNEITMIKRRDEPSETAGVTPAPDRAHTGA